MTVIVGIPHQGRVYLGADSQVSGGYLKTHHHEGKLWEAGGMIFGLTGVVREAQILEHATTFPALPDPEDLNRWLAADFVNTLREDRKSAGYDEREKDQTHVEAGPCMLVGVLGRLFVIHSDYSHGEAPSGSAVGSGCTAALGSLHTTAQLRVSVKRRIDYALEAACAHDIYCAPPFTYLTSKAVSHD